MSNISPDLHYIVIAEDQCENLLFMPIAEVLS